MPLSKSIPTAMPHIPPVMTLVTNTFNPMDLWISTSIVSRMKDATANKTRYLVLTSLMDIIITNPITNPASAEMSLTHIGSWEPFRWNDLESS